MGTRSYPLFVIDDSRQHGREKETDYIACTAGDCPFLAKSEIVQELIYTEQYDKTNAKVIFSESRNGLRIRISVLEIGSYEENRLRILMRKALKEMLERRKTKAVDINNITDGDALKFINSLLEQTRENLAQNPKDSMAIMVNEILNKIRRDYEHD